MERRNGLVSLMLFPPEEHPSDLVSVLASCHFLWHLLSTHTFLTLFPLYTSTSDFSDSIVPLPLPLSTQPSPGF